jgi:hypothetical protein
VASKKLASSPDRLIHWQKGCPPSRSGRPVDSLVELAQVVSQRVEDTSHVVQASNQDFQVFMVRLLCRYHFSNIAQPISILF